MEILTALFVFGIAALCLSIKKRVKDRREYENMLKNYHYVFESLDKLQDDERERMLKQLLML